VSEDWRRLHNEEVCNFYASPNTIRIIKSVRGDICSMHERDEKCIQNFGWKT
jgi:hypothetical protein